jgi:AbrB family looped-hinge helix DNA binding protein
MPRRREQVNRGLILPGRRRCCVSDLRSAVKVLLLQVGVRLMRITSKGQVTIPADIRERAGLLPHTEVEFEFDGKVVRVVRVKGGSGRGARVAAHLRGRGDVTMSTEAIMALTRGD